MGIEIKSGPRSGFVSSPRLGWMKDYSRGGDYYRWQDYSTNAEMVAASKAISLTGKVPTITFPEGKAIDVTSDGFADFQDAGAPNIDFGSCKFNILANVPGPRINLGLNGPYFLSADYGIGNSYIDITGEPVGLNPGMPFCIGSVAVDPGNRNEGATGSQYRVGEWLTCVSVVSQGGGVWRINFSGRPAFSLALYGLSSTNGASYTASVYNPSTRLFTSTTGTLDLGNRPIVAAYTTANYARIWWPTPGVRHITGGVFEYEDGHGYVDIDDQGWKSTAFSVTGGTPIIDGVTISRGYHIGVQCTGCYMPIVKNFDISNLDDKDLVGAGTSLGYAVGFGGCKGGVVQDGRSENVRHMYTSTGATLTVSSESTVGSLANSIQNWDTTLERLRGMYNLSSFDTHHDTFGAHFKDCVSVGDRGNGASARGRAVHFESLTIESSGSGFLAFTEYDSGDAYPGSSGKDHFPKVSNQPWAFTSCLLSGHNRVRVNGSALDVTSADCIVTGRLEITTDQHVVCFNSGGQLQFRGASIDIIITGEDQYNDVSSGIFRCVAGSASTFGETRTPETSFDESTTISIDAVSASSTQNMFVFDNTGGSALFDCRGQISGTVSDDFTAMFKTSGTGYMFWGYNARYDVFKDDGSELAYDDASGAAFFADQDERSGSFKARASVSCAQNTAKSLFFRLRHSATKTALVHFMGFEDVNSKPFYASIAIGDPASSTSERAVLISSADGAYYEAVANSNLSSHSVTSGGVAFSYRDRTLYIKQNIVADARTVGVDIVGIGGPES